MQKSVVLITGASTGIGYCTSKFLSELGWHVYAGVRKPADQDRLNKLKSVTAINLDVNNELEIEKAINLIDTNEGRLDGLVNNAGIAVSGPLMLLDKKDFQKHFNTNVIGLHMLTKTSFELLKKSKGRIINISSVSGKLSFPFMGPYSMSKHAVEAYSDALRRELYSFGIKVLLIEPGFVKTSILSKGRVEDPRLKGTIFETMANNFIKKTNENGEKNGLDPIVISKLFLKGLVHKNP
ncbi:MAG: SDR family oxidoreductase [Deltaproteobacteria bacterium]|nr:SDR family oxidoreductase [Deltaproteobacteria bacterium]